MILNLSPDYVSDSCFSKVFDVYQSEKNYISEEGALANCVASWLEVFLSQRAFDFLKPDPDFARGATNLVQYLDLAAFESHGVDSNLVTWIAKKMEKDGLQIDFL